MKTRIYRQTILALNASRCCRRLTIVPRSRTSQEYQHWRCAHYFTYRHYQQQSSNENTFLISNKKCVDFASRNIAPRYNNNDIDRHAQTHAVLQMYLISIARSLSTHWHNVLTAYIKYIRVGTITTMTTGHIEAVHTHKDRRQRVAVCPYINIYISSSVENLSTREINKMSSHWRDFQRATLVQVTNKLWPKYSWEFTWESCLEKSKFNP